MNILICLLLAAATLSSAPEIKGTVVDHNGKPVSGVSVSVEPVTGGQVMDKTVSSKDGSFEILGPCSRNIWRRCENQFGLRNVQRNRSRERLHGGRSPSVNRWTV